MPEELDAMSDASENTFLTGSLGAIYVKTALPIIFVMGMNGPDLFSF